MSMRTKYCPHCCSEKIHKVDEADGSHFHECEECDETWAHYVEQKDINIIGTHDVETVVVKSNN